MQAEFEMNPSNTELKDKVERLKQDYIKKLTTEGRIASGSTINQDFNLETTEDELEDWSEQQMDTDNGNEWDDEELSDWDNSDSWDDELVDEEEIAQSFNQLIEKNIRHYKSLQKEVNHLV